MYLIHLYSVYHRQCSKITLMIDGYLYVFRYVSLSKNVCNKYLLFLYYITKIQKILIISK